MISFISMLTLSLVLVLLSGFLFLIFKHFFDFD